MSVLSLIGHLRRLKLNENWGNFFLGESHISKACSILKLKICKEVCISEWYGALWDICDVKQTQLLEYLLNARIILMVLKETLQ